MVDQVTTEDIAESLNHHMHDLSRSFHDVHSKDTPLRSTTHVALPPRFGAGHFTIRKLVDATCSMSSFRFNHDVLLTEQSLDSTYFVSLNFGSSISFSNQSSHKHQTIPSQSLVIGKSQEGDILNMEIAGDRNIQSLSFSYSAMQFARYISEINRFDLLRKFDQQGGTVVIEQLPISSKITYLVSRLSSCPHNGALERLFFESIAAELQLAIFESIANTRVTQTNPISDRDKETLMNARELLLKDLRNPPTIAQLAKNVGLNEDKLKKGFKVQFNNTIYKTLTEQRMNNAAKMITSGEMNISEIAYNSGYENVSKFILAFKRVYGITPGAMRKETKVYI